MPEKVFGNTHTHIMNKLDVISHIITKGNDNQGTHVYFDQAKP